MTISQRRAARVPRVRAHADGLHELLRAPAGGVATSTGCSRRCAISACKTEVDILRSDAGVMTPKEAARNPVYGVLVRPVRRRRGRALRRRAGRLPERADVRHGRHVDRRLAVPGGRADDRPRDHDRPVPDQGPERRRAHGRRRRRLDRARPAAHRRAARRPAVRGRRARPRGVRPGRRRSRR